MADILQFLTVQWALGGFRAAPALLAYTTNGGQDPENFVNDIPAAFENNGLSLAIRAYDRGIRARNAVDEIEYLAYHQNTVWELYDGVNFRSAITMPDQKSSDEYAYHTGLYHVSNGEGEWIVGLYSRSGGGTGFVKCDLSTKTWTQGALTSSGFSATSGKCVVHRGKLYHPTANYVQEFDPADDSLHQYSAPIGNYAKLGSCNNRLFLFPDTGNPRLFELAFGTFVQLAVIDSGNTIGCFYGGGGDCLVETGLPSQNEMCYFWCAGTLGFRCHYFTVTPGSAPGDPITINNDDTVIPAGDDDVGLRLRYASAQAGIESWCFTEGGFNLEVGPLYSNSPQAYVMFKFNTGSFAAGSSVSCDWSGLGVPMVLREEGDPAPGFHKQTIAYSQVSSPMGDSARMLWNGPGIGSVRVEPYSDGVVSRGLLITFQVLGTGLSASGVNSLYFGIGRPLNKPNVRATLSVASHGNEWVGGAATFNPAQNRIDNVPTSPNNGATLYHDTPSGPFTPGEVIEGQSSLARGQLGVSNSSAMFVYSGTGFPFVSGEQIKGLSSLATANLVAAPEWRPTYRIVWDLDADSVPDFEWVSLQAAHFQTGGEAAWQFVISPTYQIGETLNDTTGETPLTTEGGTAQEFTSSAATPFTTESNAQETPSSAATPFTTESNAQEATSTSSTPITTCSFAEREIPEGDYFGEIYGRVAGRAHTEPSGMQLLVDSTPQGAIRPNVNFTNLANPRLQGSQGTVVDQGNRFKAEIAASLSAYGRSEPGRLVRVSGVDAASVAATDLFEVPTGYEAVVTGATARVESGTPTIPAFAGIGTNDTQDNVLGSQQLMGLLAAPQAYELISGGAMAVAAAGDTIRFGVDVAADAAQLLEITLFGYLRSL